MEAHSLNPLDLPQLEIDSLGRPQVSSPLRRTGIHFVTDQDRINVYSDSGHLNKYYELAGSDIPPSFEKAGPREKIFFHPKNTTAGIVTCGGLCPGLNDVIRTVTLSLIWQYGVKKVIGFRYGYAGLTAKPPAEPIELKPKTVEDIHLDGGTILAAGRGPQDPEEMVEQLQKRDVNILFTIGGDGTMKGASDIVNVIKKRNLKISVIGIPKTIDNDLQGVEHSFGFQTAVDAARSAITGAHNEAKAAWNCIGLVKLMGRDSGFIAAEATLANADVNFCFIPEVPLELEGTDGFLQTLERRLDQKHHAVIVVAEGAGANLIENGEKTKTDASGNIIHHDIGLFLKKRITEHFKQKNLPINIKYIDPSYIIRSQPANSQDSAFCLKLGQNAVHAAMAGRTNMVASYWNQYFVNIPIEVTKLGRKKIDPDGELWQTVLTTTGQLVAPEHEETAKTHQLS